MASILASANYEHQWNNGKQVNDLSKNSSLLWNAVCLIWPHFQASQREGIWLLRSGSWVHRGPGQSRDRCPLPSSKFTSSAIHQVLILKDWRTSALPSHRSFELLPARSDSGRRTSANSPLDVIQRRRCTFSDRLSFLWTPRQYLPYNVCGDVPTERNKVQVCYIK